MHSVHDNIRDGNHGEAVLRRNIAVGLAHSGWRKPVPPHIGQTVLIRSNLPSDGQQLCQEYIGEEVFAGVDGEIII